jgi:hypothetical protein
MTQNIQSLSWRYNWARLFTHNLYLRTPIMFASPRPCSYSAETYLKVNFSLSMPCKHTGGAEVHLHSFLTSALYGSERSALSPERTALPTGQEAGWDPAPSPSFGEENFLLSFPGLEPRSSNPCIYYLSTHFWHTMNCNTWHHVTFHRTVPSVYTSVRTPDPTSKGISREGL